MMPSIVPAPSSAQGRDSPRTRKGSTASSSFPGDVLIAVTVALNALPNLTAMWPSPSAEVLAGRVQAVLRQGAVHRDDRAEQRRGAVEDPDDGTPGGRRPHRRSRLG
jgi:hypothetical protein